MNLRAALSEGGGRMWPPGRQLPTPVLWKKDCYANWNRALICVIGNTCDGNNVTLQFSANMPAAQSGTNAVRFLVGQKSSIETGSHRAQDGETDLCRYQGGPPQALFFSIT